MAWLGAAAGAVVGALVLLVIALRVWQHFRSFHVRTLIMFGLAASAASAERGHRPTRLEHVALGVLDSVFIGEWLKKRGVAIDALRTDLEALLPPRQPRIPLHEEKDPVWSSLIEKVGRKPPALAFAALLDHHTRIARLFAKHGVTSADLKQAARDPSVRLQ